MLKYFPIIIIGDFNINMLTNTPQSTKLCNICIIIILKSEDNIFNNTQIDHIYVD